MSLRRRDLLVVGVVIRHGKVGRVPRLPCVKVSRQVRRRGITYVGIIISGSVSRGTGRTR